MKPRNHFALQKTAVTTSLSPQYEQAQLSRTCQANATQVLFLSHESSDPCHFPVLTIPQVVLFRALFNLTFKSFVRNLQSRPFRAISWLLICHIAGIIACVYNAIRQQSDNSLYSPTTSKLLNISFFKIHPCLQALPYCLVATASLFVQSNNLLSHSSLASNRYQHSVASLIEVLLLLLQGWGRTRNLNILTTGQTHKG